MVNCVVDGRGNSINGFGRQTTGSFNPTYINCVAINCSNAWEAPTDVHADSEYNASDEASTTTPPGSNPVTTDVVPADDFVDAANYDYHLKSGSLLEDAGIGTTNSNVPSTDVDGDARGVSTTGIGYDAAPVVSDVLHAQGWM